MASRTRETAPAGGGEGDHGPARQGFLGRAGGPVSPAARDLRPAQRDRPHPGPTRASAPASLIAARGDLREGRRSIWVYVRWLVGLAILVAIATNIEFGQLGRYWKPVVLVYVGGAALVLVGAQLVSALRWRILLAEDDVRWTYLARLYLIGTFFSAFLPTTVGSDAMRTGALAGEGVSLRRSVASVLLDRMLGLVGMVPLFAAGALMITANPSNVLGQFTFEASSWQVMVGLAVAAVIGSGAMIHFRRRLREKIVKWGDEFRDLAGSGLKLLVVLGLGVVVQGMNVAAWAVLVPITGLDIGWGVLLFAVPVVSIGAMLPVSAGGLGIREGIWILLLGGGFAMADVVAFSLLFFIAFCLAGVAGGILYMRSGFSSEVRNRSPADVKFWKTSLG